MLDIAKMVKAIEEHDEKAFIEIITKSKEECRAQEEKERKLNEQKSKRKSQQMFIYYCNYSDMLHFSTDVGYVFADSEDEAYMKVRNRIIGAEIEFLQINSISYDADVKSLYNSNTPYYD